jgi:pre-mRNA-processing factor 6
MAPVGPRTANTYNIPPPINYIAGAGRGAQGFTTRSDIGPARPAIETPTITSGINLSQQYSEPNFGQAPAGYIAGRGRGMGELARDQNELSSRQIQQETDRSDYSESNYDEFSGYSERLFSRGTGTPYEEDDHEADRIYEAIDERIESRRKRNREIQLLDSMKKTRTSRPTIADQFADLKRDLANVTAEQWDSIPEVGDHSLKYKQRKRSEIFTPLPDYLLQNASGQVGSNNLTSIISGIDTPGGTSSTIPGMGMAEARGTVLSLKLDKMSDSVSGQTVVDPKGYLTDLNSLKITSDAEIGDIQKARTLLSSVISTNPKHSPGWIAAARVEEYAGKILQARKLIRQGCDASPDSEDIWLEAVRLNQLDQSKYILTQAISHIPNSVKIWLLASELENNEKQKKIILRRALEFIPNSVILWKTAIELEEIDDARIMLIRAVECVPHSLEMWLALVRLESYENARKVLNQAREAIPTEPIIWITAAKLEEAHGATSEMISRIIEKALASLTQYQVVIDREQWLHEAQLVEQSGSPLTCEAIIQHTLHLNLDHEDYLQTWLDDAETCLSLSHTSPPCAQGPSADQGPLQSDGSGSSVGGGGACIVTARAIYKKCIEMFPYKKNVWLAAVMLEKQYGTSTHLETLLLNAVKHCPHAEVLWLMAAKEKWLCHDIPSARAILVEAFDLNPNSEQIWLAAIKLEWETHQLTRAQSLLYKAREYSSTERIWMKSALLEHEMGNYDTELTLLNEGIKKYPTFYKFYLMAGQVSLDKLQNYELTKYYYQQGIIYCHGSSATSSNTSSATNTSSTTNTSGNGGSTSGGDPSMGYLFHIKLSELYEQGYLPGGTSKARSILELSKLKYPHHPLLWLASIRLEKRHSNFKLVENLMARALQECPNSGHLWAEDILSCPKNQQKSKSMEGHKKCDNNPLVILAIARLFDKDKKVIKARKWYQRAIMLDPDYGDAWAYYYTFELKNWNPPPGAPGPGAPGPTAPGPGAPGPTAPGLTGAVIETTGSLSSSSSSEGGGGGGGGVVKILEGSPEDILKRCVAAEPHHGELWISISKKTEYRHDSTGTILKRVAEKILLGQTDNTLTVMTTTPRPVTSSSSSSTSTVAVMTEVGKEEGRDGGDGGGEMSVEGVETL